MNNLIIYIIVVGILLSFIMGTYNTIYYLKHKQSHKMSNSDAHSYTKETSPILADSLVTSPILADSFAVPHISQIAPIFAANMVACAVVDYKNEVHNYGSIIKILKAANGMEQNYSRIKKIKSNRGSQLSPNIKFYYYINYNNETLTSVQLKNRDNANRDVDIAYTI